MLESPLLGWCPSSETSFPLPCLPQSHGKPQPLDPGAVTGRRVDFSFVSVKAEVPAAGGRQRPGWGVCSPSACPSTCSQPAQAPLQLQFLGPARPLWDHCPCPSSWGPFLVCSNPGLCLPPAQSRMVPGWAQWDAPVAGPPPPAPSPVLLRIPGLERVLRGLKVQY